MGVAHPGLVGLSTPDHDAVGTALHHAEEHVRVILLVGRQPITGQRVNRFTHIHTSTEDLVNKVKMQRLLGQVTAACFQRCVGMDAFNAVYSTTYAIQGVILEWAG